MTHKACSALKMPCLQTIQIIPGNTASEKLSWFGILAKHVDITKDLNKVPSQLRPLLEVESAIKHKRYGVIAWALTSNDSTIVNRALKANWFFNGEHMIVDIEYFRTCIFPHISLRTRTRLVKTFVRRIKSATFAQEVFTELLNFYDYQTALPLIACCEEDFAYKTVVKRKLMLPLGIFKKIFRSNIDLAVRFLKSFIFDSKEYAPINKQIVINDPCDAIERYKPFLSLLPKSRPMDFVEIAETLALCPNIKMSNKCAKKFLSKAEVAIVRYPNLYMSILPFKVIDSKRMEVLFPAIVQYFLHDHDDFNTDLMLNYLEHYPKDKKLTLLCDTYKSIYKDNLLNNTNSVTPELLKLLPCDERFKQAKIKKKSSFSAGITLCSTYFSVSSICEKHWICYFPIQRAMQLIKHKMERAHCDGEKTSYFAHMIYSCLVNEDDNELTKTLLHIKYSSIITIPQLSKELLKHFWLIFNMRSTLNKGSIFLMYEIIKFIYEKHKYVNKFMLEKMVRLSIINKMPIRNLLYIFVSANDQVSNMQFNILTDDPLYEKQCLVTFIDVCEVLYSNIVNCELQNVVGEEKDKKHIRRKTKRELKQEQEEKNTVGCQLIVAMYDFNYRCKKSHVRPERMTIKDYPWLMNVIRVIMRSERVCPFWKEAQDALRKQERELYYSTIFPYTLTNIADVKSGAAFRLLKRNLQSIRDHLEEYFLYCKKNYKNKQVQNFVRSLRWYQDVPIIFARKCIDYLRRKITNEKPLLIFLSILLHGDTVQKLITSCHHKITKINPNNNVCINRFMNHLNICMKFLNTPLPLKFFTDNKTFDKNDRSTMLMTLRSISKRFSLPEVMLFSKSFQNMDVNMRMQWIDLMYLAVPTNYFVTFLREIWSVERNCLIRQLLLNSAQRLLCEKPRVETVDLCCEIFFQLSLDDEQLFWKMKYCSNVVDCSTYFNMWLNAIVLLSMRGLSVERTRQHAERCLRYLRRYIRVSMSKDYIKEVLRNFLFHDSVGVAEAVRNFAIKYILKLSNDELTAYSKIIFEIISTTVSTSWNMCRFDNPLFYPIRKSVHSYFEQFIIAYMKRRKNQYFDGKILDDMFSIFSTILSPEQDIQSYLLLVYAKKLHSFSYVTPITTNNFGLELAKIIPDLINNLTPYMADFIAVHLNYFLKQLYSSNNHHNVISNTISGLMMDANNTYANFVAVTMLSLQERCREYNQIIDKALDSFSQHSSCAIVLYHYLNKASFDDVSLNDDVDDTIDIN